MTESTATTYDICYCRPGSTNIQNFCYANNSANSNEMQTNCCKETTKSTSYSLSFGENSKPSRSSLYKPRGFLARTLMAKERNDNYLAHFDKKKWYECDLDKMPEHLSRRFVQLEADRDTLDFLREAEEKSDWIFTQLWHSVAKTFLGLFMTQTSINGWLQRGSMFVLSPRHFLKLIDGNDDWRANSLLDLGAGDGQITAKLAPLFRDVYVTEISHTMRTLLHRHGFQILEIDKWSRSEGRKYDIISCLNLLDRCDKPLELLDEIRASLDPDDGLLLVALVLPFSPYVESGSSDNKPKQFLPITGNTFEEQVSSVVNDVFTPAGFQLVTWSRIPYLCEGDLGQSYYWLDDSIFILKVKKD